MSVTVIVGGQFGGEGKGKMTAYLCRRYNFDAVVRCGGPNSGHTITIDNKLIVLRQIPAGVVNANTKLFLAAGCLIDVNILLKEIKLFNLTPDRLKIDKNAIIIDKSDIENEINMKLKDKIGSTCTGVGSAVIKRILRKKETKLAKDLTDLAPYVTDVSYEINQLIEKGKRIIIEGTQGFGLSIYHSPYYPYTTSRDTTASGFLSEVGVSPLVVSDVIMVIRTFPIRVGGNSGPLPKEINWETIQRESGYPYEIKEFATVTKRLRRVGRFDLEIVKKAVIVNRPNNIALMGVDYLDYKNKGAKSYYNLTEETKVFISYLEKELGVGIKFIGTGPSDYEIIDLLQDDKIQRIEGGIENGRFIKISLS